MVARSIVVYGKVQGVRYRASARDMASTLGLSGTVCNRPDGTVCLRLEGDPEAVRSMTEWCRQGPPGAQVERIEDVEVPPAGLTGFRIEW